MTRHDAMRGEMIARARLTDDELATAAARFGIVADGDALPYSTSRRSLVRVNGSINTTDDMRLEAADRMRETGDIMAGVRTARALRTTHDTPFYCSGDAFDEQYRGGPVWVGGTLVGADLVKSPIYAAGIASVARIVA